MVARWMQQKILKIKRHRRAHLKSFKMDGIIRHGTGPWPVTARTVPREHAMKELGYKDHVPKPIDPWLIKLFGLDTGTYKTTEGRLKIEQDIRKIQSQVEAYQRIVITEGKKYSLYLLYCTYSVANYDHGSLKKSDYRYLEYDATKRYLRISYQFGSRERAVAAFNNNQIQWKEIHELS